MNRIWKMPRACSKEESFVFKHRVPKVRKGQTKWDQISPGPTKKGRVNLQPNLCPPRGKRPLSASTASRSRSHWT